MLLSCCTAALAEGDRVLTPADDWIVITLDPGHGGSGGGSYSTYMVNVKSGGPKNDITRYDAIWSSPDDTSDW